MPADVVAAPVYRHSRRTPVVEREKGREIYAPADVRRQGVVLHRRQARDSSSSEHQKCEGSSVISRSPSIAVPGDVKETQANVQQAKMPAVKGAGFILQR